MQKERTDQLKLMAHCAMLAGSLAMLGSTVNNGASKFAEFLSKSEDVEIQTHVAGSPDSVRVAVDLKPFLQNHREQQTLAPDPSQGALATIGFVEGLLDQAKLGAIRMEQKDHALVVQSLQASLDAHTIKEKADSRVLSRKSRNLSNDKWLASAVSYAQGQNEALYKPVAPPATRSLIEKVAKEEGVSRLVLQSLVEQESSYNPGLVSRAGAVGLSQVLPSTALWLQTGRSKFSQDELDGMQARLKQPEYNLRVGAKYLKGLITQFDGNLDLALASYNAGPSAVERAGGIPNYPETLKYVDTIKVRVLLKAYDRLDLAASKSLNLVDAVNKTIEQPSHDLDQAKLSMKAR